MIGIVGPSGAGKSTLVNLISRLYDVNEGEIKLDGVNVKDLSQRPLRKHIGIVSQEVYVFIGTIAENIAYANPDCTLGRLSMQRKSRMHTTLLWLFQKAMIRSSVREDIICQVVKNNGFR